MRQITRDDIAQYIDGAVDGIIGGPLVSHGQKPALLRESRMREVSYF